MVCLSKCCAVLHVGRHFFNALPVSNDGTLLFFVVLAISGCEVGRAAVPEVQIDLSEVRSGRRGFWEHRR